MAGDKKNTHGRKGLSKSRSMIQPNFRNWFIASGFCILAIILYLPSLHYDFVYDDDAVIKENKFVRKGIDGISDIWTTSYFAGFNEDINARAYRPVPLTLFALEIEWMGLNPVVHHGVNILVYGLTGFFLFLLLAGLLRDRPWILAALVTFLFIIHPVHIEVVANIKSRDELFAFLNFCLAAFFLLKSVDEKKVAYFLPAWIFYGIALFSKESAITTLAILPAMLWFFRDISLKRMVWTVLPFFLIVIIYLVIRSSIVGGLNEGVTLTPLDNSLLAASSTSERIASNIFVLGIYFFKNIFPHPLLSDYSYSTIPVVGWSDARVWLSLGLYIILIFLLVKGFLKKWVVSYAIWHFFAAVSIFSSVIVLNVSAYNDRFNYNPSLGVCILTGWLLMFFWKPVKEKNNFGFFLKSNLLFFLLVSAIGVTAIVKVRQHLPVWQDRYVLFAHDVEIAPHNARMLKNHGGSLARMAFEEKNAEQRLQLAEEAITYLERSLEIYFRIPTGHIHLGNMYGLLQRYDEAETAFKNALSIDPNSHFASANLANVYYRTGRYQQAADLLEKLNKKNYSSNDYYLLALIYSKLGDSEKAETYRQLSGK